MSSAVRLLKCAPSRSYVLLTIAVALGCLLSLSSQARAADDEAEGRRRFQHGQELFLQARYLEAAQEFEAGYAVAPRNGFLINIAHSYRRAGELAKAKKYYQKLLEVEPNTPQRPEVEANIRSIDDALALEGLNVPKPAPKKSPVPNPDEAFRRRVAAEAELDRPAADAEKDEDGSVFGKAWFWALVLSAAAVGTVVAVTLSRSGGDCNATKCVTELP
ncbi:MAG: tetratricopeptide repeat protein [Deltaproteobacteria bacterium]|nr:tetratricopeptide repeat protein [Deltaproteobacteria bacterium]